MFYYPVPLAPTGLIQWKILFKCLAIFFASLLLWVLLNSIDSEDYDDSGLLSVLIEVPDSSNGYNEISFTQKEDYSLFTSDEKAQAQDIILGKLWDEQWVNDLFERHKHLFNSMTGVVEKPYFRYPIDNDKDALPNYLPVMNLIDLALLRSIYLVKTGDIDESINILRLAITFTLRTSLGEDYWLINYMIGMISFDKIAVWVHQLASHYPLNVNQYARLQSTLKLWPTYENDKFSMVFSGEFEFFINTIESDRKKSMVQRLNEYYALREAWGAYEIPDEMSDSLGLQGFLEAVWPYCHTHLNRSLNRLAPQYAAMQKQTALPCEKQTQLDTHEGPWNKILISGFFNSGLDLSNYRDYFEERCFRHNYYHLLKTIVAFNHYNVQNKKEPNAIKDLVPNYLDKLPKDHFSGHNLVYSKELRWFYSISRYSDSKGGSDVGKYQGRCKKDSPCWDNPTLSIDYEAEN